MVLSATVLSDKVLSKTAAVCSSTLTMGGEFWDSLFWITSTLKVFSSSERKSVEETSDDLGTSGTAIGSGFGATSFGSGLIITGSGLGSGAGASAKALPSAIFVTHALRSEAISPAV